MRNVEGDGSGAGDVADSSEWASGGVECGAGAGADECARAEHGAQGGAEGQQGRVEDPPGLRGGRQEVAWGVWGSKDCVRAAVCGGLAGLCCAVCLSSCLSVACVNVCVRVYVCRCSQNVGEERKEEK